MPSRAGFCKLLNPNGLRSYADVRVDCDISLIYDFLRADIGILGGRAMTAAPATPLFTDPRRLLLEMARQHALPDLLRLVVDRLAESPRVALARIWLMQPSADCDGCAMPAECRDRSACLHLVASAGRSALDPEVEWT